MASTTPRAPAVIPVLRYDDAPAAIEWLCEAFGFERLLVIAGDRGAIAHGQLAHDNGVVMLSSSRDDGLGIGTPSALGGVNQCVHVVVADPDAHCRRAVAAGADLALDLHDEEWGRGYACRDPEGHLWFFGTYRPQLG
jgi:uncharacterized glyoxalase superfamily protein PhnB